MQLKSNGLVLACYAKRSTARCYTLHSSMLCPMLALMLRIQRHVHPTLLGEHEQLSMHLQKDGTYCQHQALQRFASLNICFILLSKCDVLRCNGGHDMLHDFK